MAGLSQLDPSHIVPVEITNHWPPPGDPIMSKLNAAFMAGLIWLEYTAYPGSWGALGALAVGQGPDNPITVDPNTDLICTQLNFSAFSAPNTPIANPDMLIQITEQNGRGQWFSREAHVSLVTGQSRNTGSMPKVTAAPRYCRGNNTLQVALTDIGNVASRCYIAFEGYRVTYLKTTRTELLNVPE